MDSPSASPKSASSALLELLAEPRMVRVAVSSYSAPDSLNDAAASECALGSPLREICTAGSDWGDESKKSCRLGEASGAKAPSAARLRKGYRFKARLYRPFDSACRAYEIGGTPGLRPALAAFDRDVARRAGGRRWRQRRQETNDAEQGQWTRGATGRSDHAPYAKDNFQFERRISAWRKPSGVDLRRKEYYSYVTWRDPRKRKRRKG